MATSNLWSVVSGLRFPTPDLPGGSVVAQGFHRDGGPLDQYLDTHYRGAEEFPARIQVLVRIPPR